MLSSQLPSMIPLPFAKNAAGGYTRQISLTSLIGIQAGAASWPDGFPPLNFQSIETGGVPPFGQDFNGLLNQITAGLQWVQAGGLATYNPVLQNEIGGYPNGAILVKANHTGFWVSTADNNLTNPDTAGAGWSDLLALYVKGDGGTYSLNISGNAATATTANTAVSAQSAQSAVSAQTAATATSANSATYGATAAVGDNSTRLATTQFVNEMSFGAGGQAWTDVTASRGFAPNTFTNNTGRPILVAISMNNPGATTEVTASVGSVVVADTSTAFGNQKFAISFLVPPGAVYTVTNSVAGTSILHWAELR